MERSEILAAAEKCVCGHRELDYGSPEDNFGKIAKLWSVYLGIAISSVDVAMMMALLKIARVKGAQLGRVSEDSFVDLAGYAACGGEIATRERDAKIAKNEAEIAEAKARIEDIKSDIAAKRTVEDARARLNQNGCCTEKVRSND